MKVEFNKEIESQNKTQTEIKLRMKTLAEQTKPQMAACPIDKNTNERISGLEDKVRNG